MRISDWSSDVCSSDLQHRKGQRRDAVEQAMDDVTPRTDQKIGKAMDVRQAVRGVGARRPQQDVIGFVAAQHVVDQVGTEGHLSSGLLLPRMAALDQRSEEHTSELQSLMRISYAVFCLKKKNQTYIHIHNH